MSLKGFRRNPAVGRRRLAMLAVAVAVAAGALAVAHAQQRIWSGYYGYTPPKFPTSATYDGSFNFCRAMFTSNRREKQGWSTDYPGADINFSVRLAELTKVPVKFVNDGKERIPDAVVVRLTDDWLFRCSFTLMEDAGTALFTDAEVERLRECLLKGGFLLVSDYHGILAKAQFDDEIARVPPRGAFPIVDLTRRTIRSGTRCSGCRGSRKWLRFRPGADRGEAPWSAGTKAARRRRARHRARSRPHHGRHGAQHKLARSVGTSTSTRPCSSVRDSFTHQLSGFSSGWEPAGNG
jgi:Domain of unknown function (DUF4159)